MPYRVDLRAAGDDAIDRVIELGALDVERSADGTLAVLMPDTMRPEQLASVLGRNDLSVSPAIARDEGSVWILRPRPIRVGRIRIDPCDEPHEPGVLRLTDSAAFGTGLHPTTALCLDALQDEVAVSVPTSVLDVGTGSGVLALAALVLGVPRAIGIDVDDRALAVAAENARINGLSARLELVRGGPEGIAGSWPLVLANVLAAPLIEMAPALVRRLGPAGQLVLSGIPSSLALDVDRAYRNLGLRSLRVTSREGWVALVMQTSW